MKTKHPASVQSIERGLTLLEELSCETEGLGVSALARRTNLPVSTVHRLLSVFVRRGYIARDNGRGRYRIDTKLLGIGFHPLAFFCQAYPLICRYFSERMGRGEIDEVFLRVVTRSFSVRADHGGEKDKTFLVPELRGSIPVGCRANRHDPDLEACGDLDRNGGGVLFRLAPEGDSWCTCVPIQPGRGGEKKGRIGAGGTATLPRVEIERISSSLAVLREEIERTFFVEDRGSGRA